MNSYRPIACDLHGYLGIVCFYRYQPLPEPGDGAHFEAEAHTTYTRAVRPGGGEEGCLEMVVEGVTLLLRLDHLLVINAPAEMALFDRMRPREGACSRASGVPSSHLGDQKSFSQFQNYLISLLLKQTGLTLMQIDPEAEKMSATMTERDGDHKFRELCALGRRCWDIYQQGLLIGILHNEDDARAYRIKLGKEEELR